MLEELLQVMKNLVAALQQLSASVAENTKAVNEHKTTLVQNSLNIQNQTIAVQNNTAAVIDLQNTIAENTLELKKNTEAVANVNFNQAGSNATSSVNNNDDSAGSSASVTTHGSVNVNDDVGTLNATANVVEVIIPEPVQTNVEITKTDNIAMYDTSVSASGFNRTGIWNVVNVGAPFPDRIVAIAFGVRDYKAGNKVRINGADAQIVEVGNGSKALSLIAWAYVPAGNTVQLEVDFVSWPSDIVGSAYSIKNAKLAAFDSVTAASSSTQLNASMSTKQGAAGIATSYIEDWNGSAAISNCTWSGFERSHVNLSGYHAGSQAIYHNNVSANGVSIIADWQAASSDDMSMAAVMFEPSNTVTSNTSTNTVSNTVTTPTTNTAVNSRVLSSYEVEQIFGPFHTTASNPNLTWTSGLDDGRISIAPDPEDDTKPVLRCLFKAGTRGHLQFNKDLGGKWNEAIIEYKFRFADALFGNVAFQRGGKLPGFAGGTGPTGGAIASDGMGFSSRMNWIEQSASSPNYSISCYLYDMDNTGTGDHMILDTNNPMRSRAEKWSDGFPDLVGDKWFKVTQRMVMNTPGIPNGLVQCWIDDVLALDIFGIRTRSVGSVGLDTFMFSTFFGGSDTAEWQALRDTYIMYSDFKITIVDTGEVITFDIK